MIRQRYFFIIILMVLFPIYTCAKGKVKIYSDQKWAWVYIDGAKKAQVAEGAVEIALDEGEHFITVKKPIDKTQIYTQTKKIFIANDVLVELKYKLHIELTEQSKIELTISNKEKKKRWVQQNGIVVDKRLGLMWQDNKEVEKIRNRWGSAVNYCKELALHGYDDWRLPRDKELESIIDYEQPDKHIVPSFRYLGDKEYWTSVSYFYEGIGYYKTTNAWCVNFNYGEVKIENKNKKLFARCVRGGSRI